MTKIEQKLEDIHTVVVRMEENLKNVNDKGCNQLRGVHKRIDGIKYIGSIAVAITTITLAIAAFLKGGPH